VPTGLAERNLRQANPSPAKTRSTNSQFIKWRINMKVRRYACGNCDGDLEYIGGGEWKCMECDAIYECDYDPEDEFYDPDED